MRQITELKIVTDITTRNSEQIKTNNRTPQKNRKYEKYTQTCLVRLTKGALKYGHITQVVAKYRIN